VFGIFSGFYYWWPKIFGRMLDERLGKLNFWLMVIGVNLTFGPMHILGLQGEPRRMYVWTKAQAGTGPFNLGTWNLVATIGAFTLALGILTFIINVAKTARKPANAPLDPWDARSLEWLTANPPKEHNFDVIPTVRSIDEFFHRKYAEDANGRLEKIATAEELHAEQERHADQHIHLPSPSYWPIVLSAGLPFIGYGLIFDYWHDYKQGRLDHTTFVTWLAPVRQQIEATLEDAVLADVSGLSGSCADILEHRQALWTFVDQAGVEPTNNHAEREIRAFVLWRKRSFGTQSERGNTFAENLMTVAYTARKQQRNVLAFLSACCNAARDDMPPPSLFGAAAAV